MRLTRLRLNGFKSFADPTELAIATGLTGVVGPNGCGKSNLLEALRWVMGETRPTQMRGQGMEDVIFAGTARRGARAWAEVALCFEREGRETELVRRIARDGGSAYRLGGKETRARDVQVMFADAASGAQSPALVRQGQIAELIGQKPAARRRVIEEAAGVAGLQARRGEAAQRLSAAEANLARVSEVTAGLAERLRGLERQARNAERYREVAAAIRVAEGQLLWRAWATAEEALAAAEGAARTRGALAARAEAAAAEAAEAREAAEAGLPGLRSALAEAADLVTRLKARGEAEAAEAQRAWHRLSELEKAAGETAQDEAREAALMREAAETLARLAGEAERLQGAGEDEEERLSLASEALEAAGQALRDVEAELTVATEAAARLSAEAEAMERRTQDIARARDRTAQDAARAAATLAGLETAAAQAEALAQEASESAAVAEEALALADEALVDAETALGPAQEAEAAARAEAAEAQARAAGVSAEVQALERLVAADGSRQGQVGERLRVAPGYEAAVAAALGRDLRAPVAEAGSGWVRLPRLKEPPPLPEGARTLSEFVEGPAELSRRLSQVGVVDASEAPGLWPELRAGQRLVTPEGDLWRWDGLRLLAQDAAEAAAEAEAMRRAARLPGLMAEAEEARERADLALAALTAASQELSRAVMGVERARAARRTAERKAQEAARLAGKAEADRALAAAKQEAAQEVRAKADAAWEAAEAALSEALEAKAGLPDPRDARARAAEAGHKAAVARSDLMAARTAAEDLRRAASARTRRLADIGREEGLWSGRCEAAERRTADLAARRVRLLEEIEEARLAPGEIAARAEEVAAELAAATARRTGLEAELARAEAVLREAQESERAAERAASQAREARAGAEAARLAAAEHLAAEGARILEERGQSPRELLVALGGDAGAVPPEPALHSDLASLRRKRDAIGPVNLRAEEDARALREEQDGLMREAEDLSAAVAELRRALGALNREGREKMLEAFGRVNAEFGRLFGHLFGGGEARLAWVDGPDGSDDPLEAGVEIMAQPPGKTLGTLSLLSGGEQTLTALALIFAVFLVAPAPVCVLDEVDAPLDDANVGRLCDLLDAMAKETDTRFLVITHHAVTMARMDRLYGVTMAERGVSQLVSVDLRAAEAMVA